VKFAPAFLKNIHPRFQTPANALLVNMGIGIIALLTGKTSEIITISVFGALTLYIVSMIALLQLRKKEPTLERPFKVPMYPFFPVIALIIAIVSFVAMTIYNLKLALIYFLIIGVCYAAFKLFARTN
jgi:ethanolamine permease